jgi:UDP-2,3-diacylglucosamine pyrophosphatase LpxH
MGIDQQKVINALTKACDPGRAEVYKGSYEIGDTKLVVLSDLHRGARDNNSDDFWRCEEAYNAALGYYWDADFTLILLGDVEELWENAPAKLKDRYVQTSGLEEKFHNADRLLRVFGNHDSLWADPEDVAKFFTAPFQNTTVYEALRFEVTDNGKRRGEFVLVHGHQGSADANDGPFVRVRAFAVRRGFTWLQKAFNLSGNTPARDHALRNPHSIAMRDWALAQGKESKDNPVILIAGHTHQPVFGTSAPEVSTRRELKAVQAEYAAAPTPMLAAELEMLSTLPYGDPAEPMEVPCYFNTGCCCFHDGDVTGIEIADERIRLVRWLDDEREPVRKVLARDFLRDVFTAVAAGQDRQTPELRRQEGTRVVLDFGEDRRYSVRADEQKNISFTAKDPTTGKQKQITFSLDDLQARGASGEPAARE